MKFISKENNTTVEKLWKGDIFICHGEVFIITEVDTVFSLYEVVNDSSYSCIWGLSLSNGSLMPFDYGEVVRQIEAEIHEA